MSDTSAHFAPPCDEGDRGGSRLEVRVESAAEDVVRHDLGFDDGPWNARILKGRVRTFVREAMR